MKNDAAYLIAQIAQHDDQAAFRELFVAFSEKLARFASVYLKSHMLADEAVSEVFAKVWISRKQLTNIENVNAYLYRAVRNESLKLKSKEEGKDLVRLDFLPTEEPQLEEQSTPFDLLAYQELREALEKSVAALPEQCREVFLLAKESGFKYAEIAEVLGISPNTVENHMSKALRLLRGSLDLYLTEKKLKKNRISNHSWSLLLIFFPFVQKFLETA